MGTPDFAVPSLEALDKKYDVIGIFTKPDKPNMRGKKIKFNPVKQYGIEHDIPVYQPKSLKNEEIQNQIKDLNPDLIVVVAYGKILPQEIIDIPEKYGIINVHSSLLPKYRGAAPINAAIIHGEEETGVSIMYIVEALDAGDVITTRKTKIEDTDNFETLHDRLQELGSEALLEAIEMMEEDRVVRQPQDESKVTFVKPFKKEDCKIDWNKTSREIFNFVRGMDPLPTAYSMMDGKIFKIYQVIENDTIYEDGKNGEIVAKIKKKGFVVKTKDGSVILSQVKPENKKILTGVDIMNGNLLKIGDIFE